MRNLERCVGCPVTPCLVEEENFSSGTSRKDLLFVCDAIRLSSATAFNNGLLKGFSGGIKGTEEVPGNPYLEHFENSGGSNGR